MMSRLLPLTPTLMVHPSAVLGWAFTMDHTELHVFVAGFGKLPFGADRFDHVLGLLIDAGLAPESTQALMRNPPPLDLNKLLAREPAP